MNVSSHVYGQFLNEELIAVNTMRIYSLVKQHIVHSVFSVAEYSEIACSYSR